MPVIINEFEITPAPPQPAAPPAEETPPPQEPQVREMEQILRRRAERRLRIWAH